jgi:hypothetical protein
MNTRYFSVQVLVIQHCFLSLSPGICVDPSHAWIKSEVNTIFTLQHSVYWTDEIFLLHMAGLLFGEMMKEEGTFVSKKIECLL